MLALVEVAIVGLGSSGLCTLERIIDAGRRAPRPAPSVFTLSSQFARAAGCTRDAARTTSYSGSRRCTLEDQDRTLWDRAEIDDGLGVLEVALRFRQEGNALRRGGCSGGVPGPARRPDENRRHRDEPAPRPCSMRSPIGALRCLLASMASLLLQLWTSSRGVCYLFETGSGSNPCT